MRKLIGAVVGLAVLGAVGTCALSRCGGGETPAPLWSLSDLPPLDQSDANGWVGLAAAVQADLHVEPPDAVRDAVAMVEQDDTETFTERLAETREALDSMMADPKVQAALAAWRVATEAQSFSDGCPADPGTSCPHFDVYRLGQTATAEILWMRAHGDEVAAFSALAQMVALHREYRTSSRNLFAAVSATASLKRSVALAALLVSAREDESASAVQARAQLRSALDTVGRDQAVARRALIGEYLMANAYLRAIIDGDPELVGEDVATQRWLFDEAWARVRIDGLFTTAMQALEGGSPMPAQAEAPSWMDTLTHPIGAPMVRTLDPGMSANPILEELRRDREVLARQCDELLVQTW